MKLFKKAKDGGPESPVDAYVLIEIKSLFSIMLLKFNKGCRDNYHTHAFNALTWFLCGNLYEEDIDGSIYIYKQSLSPKVTKKDKNHRVKAVSDSWCFTLRGPWDKYWTEDNLTTKETITFTHGREVVSTRVNK